MIVILPFDQLFNKRIDDFINVSSLNVFNYRNKNKILLITSFEIVNTSDEKHNNSS